MFNTIQYFLQKTYSYLLCVCVCVCVRIGIHTSICWWDHIFVRFSLNCVSIFLFVLPWNISLFISQRNSKTRCLLIFYHFANFEVRLFSKWIFCCKNWNWMTSQIECQLNDCVSSLVPKNQRKYKIQHIVYFIYKIYMKYI